MLPFIQTAYLFALGSIIGWVLEFFYRKFFDPVNVERKWLNPGFLTDPYLPLYGFALLLLFWLRRLEGFIPIENSYIRKAVLFLIMAACITALEYFTGLIFIVRLKIMLWDYTQFWGNIQGIICPMYSFFWLVLSFGYCFFLDPTITQTVEMLPDNQQKQYELVQARVAVIKARTNRRYIYWMQFNREKLVYRILSSKVQIYDTKEVVEENNIPTPEFPFVETSPMQTVVNFIYEQPRK